MALLPAQYHTTYQHNTILNHLVKIQHILYIMESHKIHEILKPTKISPYSYSKSLRGLIVCRNDIQWNLLIMPVDNKDTCIIHTLDYAPNVLCQYTDLENQDMLIIVYNRSHCTKLLWEYNTSPGLVILIWHAIIDKAFLKQQ